MIKQMCLLVGQHMYPIPENITVLADYGNVFLMTSGERGRKGFYQHGDHIILEAEEEILYNWLGQFDCVWVGKGHPMMQNFDLMSFAELQQ